MTEATAPEPTSLLPSTHLPKSSKIRSQHLLLLAIIYLRQSTITQVRKNLESQRRQYDLKDRATSLGWPEELVMVIDEDLGRSGSDTSDRTGFKRLISEVALGHVGIIFALEASRLARNSEDWQHLLRLCGVTSTLIADAENIYDPRLRDDRTLLGFKGQFSEWELDTLRDRLVAGAQNKARRGELYHGLPVGYTLAEDGLVEQHPDEAVREAITRVFRRFQATGSARAAARSLSDDGSMLPVRQDVFGRKPPRWQPASFGSVHAMITNPFYAGAYGYGKTRIETTATPDGNIVKHRQITPFDQWSICIPNHHPAYISWEEFRDIQKRLEANRRGYCIPGPIGEGASLLAGILRCGPCGRKMEVRYGGSHHDVPRFKCAGKDALMDKRNCQSFSGQLLEQRLSQILLEVLEPHGMEAALLALKDWDEQRVHQERQWDLGVARAEEVEARARRKYEEVEPGHRLVARTLEQAWERALQSLEEARRTRDLKRSQTPPPLTEEEQQHLRRSAVRLEVIWKDPATSRKDRKEIVRLLIHHVDTWIDLGKRRLTFRIHWTTGKISEDYVRLKNLCKRALEIGDDDLDIIRRMAADYTDAEIANVLSCAGRLQPEGVHWNMRAVKSVREARGWMKAPPCRGQFATLEEMINTLHVSPREAYRLFRSGKVKAEQPYPQARWRVDRASLEQWAKRKRGRNPQKKRR